jgi:predicted DNA-binding transcriptional regulator AlpA
MENDFIQIEEAAQLVGISPARLAQLRFMGTGPQFYKPTPRKVLYKRSEVLAWIEASAQTSTAG